MAEEQNGGQTGASEIKTAQDVRMDQLTARLDALEAENKKLREANAGLYALSNPVPEPQAQQAQQVLPADVQIVTEDVALKTFEKNIYGENENGK